MTQVITNEVALCVQGTSAPTRVAAYITSRFLDLVHVASTCIKPPVDAAWIFLALHAVVFERLAKKDMHRFGYDERGTAKSIEIDSTADIRRILEKVKSGTETTSKYAAKVKRSTALLLEIMIRLLKVCKDESTTDAMGFEYGALGCELMFIIYAVRGMQCEAGTGEMLEVARVELLGAAMEKLRERWIEYGEVLDGVRAAVGKVVPYTGGTVVSPLHIIAYSMYEEYDVTPAEFEEGLNLPTGSISHFPFPQANHGWLKGWATKLLGSMKMGP